MPSRTWRARGVVVATIVLAGCGGTSPNARDHADDPRFMQGTLLWTDAPGDLALEGRGWLAVSREGGVRYVRGGSFRPDRDGILTDAHGGNLLAIPSADCGGPLPLRLGPVRVAAGDAAALVLTVDGVLGLRRGGEVIEPVARVPVVAFDFARELQQVGPGAFLATEASGPPRFGRPNEGGRGWLHQGMLEDVSHTLRP